MNALSDENLRKNAFQDVTTAVLAAKAKGILREEILTTVHSIYNEEAVTND